MGRLGSHCSSAWRVLNFASFSQTPACLELLAFMKGPPRKPRVARPKSTCISKVHIVQLLGLLHACTVQRLLMAMEVRDNSVFAWACTRHSGAFKQACMFSAHGTHERKSAP